MQRLLSVLGIAFNATTSISINLIQTTIQLMTSDNGWKYFFFTLVL